MKIFKYNFSSIFSCVFIISFFIFSCTHSNVSSSIQKSISSDKSYSSVLDKVTRTSYVTDVFESVLTVNVSFFSEEFKSALEERYAGLFDKKGSNMIPTDGVSFMISIYTNDRTLMNLEDKKIWSIFMESNSNRVDDFNMTAISDKNRVKPFFNYINNWSREYLITFRVDPKDVNPNNLKLFLSNMEAKVEFSW